MSFLMDLLTQEEPLDPEEELLDPEEKYRFEERAAIIEFDGGYSREESELLARGD